MMMMTELDDRRDRSPQRYTSSVSARSSTMNLTDGFVGTIQSASSSSLRKSEPSVLVPILPKHNSEHRATHSKRQQHSLSATDAVPSSPSPPARSLPLVPLEQVTSFFEMASVVAPTDAPSLWSRWLVDRLPTRTALRTAQIEISEQRFMAAMCKSLESFKVFRTLGAGAFGAVLEVKCTKPGHRWPNKRYAMKVCFNYDLSTSQAQGAFANEYKELVSLPTHHNVVRFLCDFFGEITDSIRSRLPEFARESSIVRKQDGSTHNRKTQFFVLELADCSLGEFLRDQYPPQSIVPHRLVATIVSQVGSALLHLEQHRVAHRDIKRDNILLNRNPKHDARNPLSLPITRCIVSDFGTACQLNERLRCTVRVSDTGALLSSSLGNPAHIAPELHATLAAAKAARRACEVELDYSKQAVFELGVLGFEIVTGTGPIEDYPSPSFEYRDDQIATIPEERLGRDQAEMLRRAISFEAASRPSLVELIRCFDGARGSKHRDRTS